VPACVDLDLLLKIAFEIHAGVTTTTMRDMASLPFLVVGVQMASLPFLVVDNRSWINHQNVSLTGQRTSLPCAVRLLTVLTMRRQLEALLLVQLPY
jgi:hypothetical protein